MSHSLTYLAVTIPKRLASSSRDPVCRDIRTIPLNFATLGLSGF
ncbi:predicted protein [Botrytis cinerea T4]|uniref:Uncharacterized protein n=1 Tax=Botryotinia fuckeliana (strain T4) TaxID=999810 RepID=G2YTQ6_BOTF4|nr:predicted protein [Botrytis cinerea T4]